MASPGELLVFPCRICQVQGCISLPSLWNKVRYESRNGVWIGKKIMPVDKWLKAMFPTFVCATLAQMPPRGSLLNADIRGSVIFLTLQTQPIRSCFGNSHTCFPFSHVYCPSEGLHCLLFGQRSLFCAKATCKYAKQLLKRLSKLIEKKLWKLEDKNMSSPLKMEISGRPVLLLLLQ